MLACVVGCSSSIDEVEQVNNEPPCMVGVTTRSIDESSYPLNLYAFYSETGTLAGCATAETASDILTIPLRLGSYDGGVRDKTEVVAKERPTDDTSGHQRH